MALLLDLHRQLTCGGQDQHNGPVTTLCTQPASQHTYTTGSVAEAGSTSSNCSIYSHNRKLKDGRP